MPTGRNGASRTGNSSTERPIVFQKFIKSGGKTYASQIKIATNGKRYLALIEGQRDPETQEVKKHIIRVFEEDLKDFFAMLQETVVYLRTHKSPESSVQGMVAAQAARATKPPVARATRTSADKPATAASARSRGSGATATKAKTVIKSTTTSKTTRSYRATGKAR